MRLVGFRYTALVRASKSGFVDQSADFSYNMAVSHRHRAHAGAHYSARVLDTGI